MEYYDICLVACCVIFLFGMVAAWLIVRKDEKEHQKRMEEIRKEKEQV